MANTKSAERRTRSSLTRRGQNRSIKSRIGTLEKNYLSLVKAGKKEDATIALRSAQSALDKAAKSGVIPKARANRKKSRLAAHLSPAPAAAAKPA